MTPPRGAGRILPDRAGAAGRVSRGTAVARHTILNLAGTGLPLLVAVVAMPPVVRGLGPDRFGILGLVWVLLGYLAVLDLGIGRATTRYAAEAIARGDDALLAGTARTAAVLQVAIGTVSGLGLAAIAPVLVRDVLRVPPELTIEAVRSLQIVGVVGPIAVLSNTFRGVLEAGGRFGLVNLVRSPVTMSTFLIPLAGVALGWSLVPVVALIVAVRCAALLVFVAACLRTWPALRAPAWLPRQRRREILSFGGWLTVSSIIAPLFLYLDRFAIGALVGLAAVGFYSAPHEMVMRLTIVPASLATALFPAFTGMTATGTPAGGLFGRSLRLLLIGLGPIAVLVIVLAPEALTLWLGDTFSREGATSLRLLTAGLLITGLAYIPYGLVQAAGRADLTGRLHLVELPIHLLLLWLFISTWGIAGAAAAWLVRNVLDAAALFVLVSRMGLVSAVDLRARALVRVLGALMLLAALTAAVKAVAATPIMTLALAGFVAAVWAAIALPALLDASERGRLLQALGARGRA